MDPASWDLGIRKGAWSKQEDILLQRCVERYGEGNWHLVPSRSGLRRCRKSCRLRWINYLSPNIRRGHFSQDEVDLVIRMHKLLGNRWSLISRRLSGRTANDIKNLWNSLLNNRMNSRSVLASNQTPPPPSVVVPIRPQARRFTTLIPHLGTFSSPTAKTQPSRSPTADGPSTDHEEVAGLPGDHKIVDDKDHDNSWLYEMMNLEDDQNFVPSGDHGTDFDMGELLTLDSPVWNSIFM